MLRGLGSMLSWRGCCGLPMLGSRQREKEKKKKKINMRRRWDERLMGGEGSRSGRERKRERERVGSALMKLV